MNVSPGLFTLTEETPGLVVTNFSEFIGVSLFLKVSFEHFHGTGHLRTHKPLLGHVVTLFGVSRLNGNLLYIKRNE